jgi:hypothetical protein
MARGVASREEPGERAVVRAVRSCRGRLYNFARPHQSLGKNTTPAMAAGISDHVWTCEEIAALLD